MRDHWMVTCDNCAGEGGFVSGNAYVNTFGHIGYASRADEWGDTWHDCPACHGAGWVYDDEPPPEIDPEEAFETAQCDHCGYDGDWHTTHWKECPNA